MSKAVANTSFLQLLTVLFIGLKLTDYITWSWTWVLAPLWGPFAFVASLFLLWWIGYGTIVIVEAVSKTLRERKYHGNR